MSASLNQVLIIGTITKNFPPRSERGPALLKIKTERPGYGAASGQVFADYVPITVFGRPRDAVASFVEGDLVRVVGTVSERKGTDDVYRVQIVADEIMRFGEPAEQARPQESRRPAAPAPYSDSDEIPF